ncbi:hypothetical protein CLU79DRAFT_157104 [Phycomyces nitens]|nr:hypothetical protein CLU79DRAFT_157104 [Phycomyces nitens]
MARFVSLLIVLMVLPLMAYASMPSLATTTNNTITKTPLERPSVTLYAMMDYYNPVKPSLTTNQTLSRFFLLQTALSSLYLHQPSKNSFHISPAPDRTTNEPSTSGPVFALMIVLILSAILF